MTHEELEENKQFNSAVELQEAIATAIESGRPWVAIVGVQNADGKNISIQHITNEFPNQSIFGVLKSVRDMVLHRLGLSNEHLDSTNQPEPTPLSVADLSQD